MPKKVCKNLNQNEQNFDQLWGWRSEKIQNSLLNLGRKGEIKTFYEGQSVTQAKSINTWVLNWKVLKWQIWLSFSFKASIDLNAGCTQKDRYDKSEGVKNGVTVKKQNKVTQRFKSPNIVKFFGFFEHKTDIFLILEYMNGGTLFDYLNEVYLVGVQLTISFLRDIIEAIIYLHQRSIAHRDIKPENIVISKEGVAKLCDFGWSAIIETTRKTYCGTFEYSPPEILERKNYDMSVDAWCIGILTYELLTGKVPFEGNRNQIAQKIVNVDTIKIQYKSNECPGIGQRFYRAFGSERPKFETKSQRSTQTPSFHNSPPKKSRQKQSNECLEIDCNIIFIKSRIFFN